MRLTAAGGRIDEHARTLARLGRSALRDAGRRGEALRGRLAELAAPAPRRGRAPPSARTGERIAAAGRGRLREAAATLQGVERLCQQLAPERTLERGFSLTRDAAGRLVRQPDQVRSGDLVTTRVAGGDFTSRVEDAEWRIWPNERTSRAKPP